MDDIHRINEALEKYPKEIFAASEKTEETRLIWMLADAQKDYQEAGAYLEAKTRNLTEGQAKAEALIKVHDTNLKVISLESKYRRALADQLRVENEFTSIRKQANLLEMAAQKS